MKDDNAKRLRADRVYLAGGGLRPRRVPRPGRAHGRSGGLSFRKRRRLERPDLPRRRRCAAPPPRESRMEMMAEWVEAMTDGPGIIVFRKTFADLGPIEAANAHFWAMIDEQHKNNSARGDHFAKPGANDRVWKRAGKALSRRPGRLRRLLRRRRHRARQRGLARTVLPDHLAAQRRQSGRRRAGPAPRLSHGLPDSARDRAISGARPSAVADAHPAGRGRALRHAARIRADALSAVLADLPARLPCGPARRIPRLFRDAQGPAAGGDRRRRLLQSGCVPRGRLQSLEGHQAHRQPAASLERLRPRDGASTG